MENNTKILQTVQSSVGHAYEWSPMNYCQMVKQEIDLEHPTSLQFNLNTNLKWIWFNWEHVLGADEAGGAGIDEIKTTKATAKT